MKTRTRSGKRARSGARLGQHFLTNPVVAHAVADSAGVDLNVSVLEIGPGTGALTRVLLEKGSRVTAIEKDPVLAEGLATTFAEEIATGSLTLINADVRDIDPRTIFRGPYVLAANIPYYITGEIIRQFLTTSHKPSTMSLLMQKEVAERIVARDGKGSILSISVKAYGTPRIIRKVPPGNFAPPPSVDSAVLQIADISDRFFEHVDEARFFAVVRAGFSSKRKLLSSNLRSVMEDPVAVLTACNIDARARAEDLTPADWQQLASDFTAQD